VCSRELKSVAELPQPLHRMWRRTSRQHGRMFT
jgi:hypothetical protein